MKLGKGSPSVWPGYVAAVASLLLSLLLLLGILVFAMTQVHNIVNRHKESITRSLLEKEIRHRASQAVDEPPPPAAQPAQVAKAPLSSQPEARQEARTANKSATRQEAARAAIPGKGALHLRLIFEAGAASLPQAQLAEMAAAMQRQQVKGNTAWELKVEVPASDPVFERSAYRLMLHVRSALIDQGIPQKAIRMHMERTQARPAGYELGEIAIHVLTHDKPAAERGQR